MSNRNRRKVTAAGKAKAKAMAKGQFNGGLSFAGIVRRMAWMVGAFGVLILIASLMSFTPLDRPSHAAAPLNATPANWCGSVGAYLAYETYLRFGIGAWVLVAGAVAFMVGSAIGRVIDQLALRIVGLLLMAISVSGFVALVTPNAGPMPEGAGGLVAIFCVEQLATRFSTLGTMLVLAMGFGVGATLAVDSLVAMVPTALAAVWRKLCEINWPRPVLVLDAFKGGVRGFGLSRWGIGQTERPERMEREPASSGGTAVLEKPAKRRPAAVDVDDEGEPDAEPLRESRTIKINRAAEKADQAAAKAEAEAAESPSPTAAANPRASKKAEPAVEAEAEEPAAPVAAEAPAPVEERKPLDPAALREKIKNLPISIANRTSAPPPAPQQDLSGYKFPPIEILEDPETSFSDEMAGYVREQAEILETALQTYRIDAEVVAIDAGPVITLYEVQLAPGTKVAAIGNVASDIARELKAQNVRIVPNTAGKSTVGIEVPNLKKEKVRLKELMALGGQQVFEKMALPMFLGKDASGNPLISDLAAMPHMLIAGTTGSGKSVCINSIIMSFLYARRPDELKLILVDPKMVEMAQFRDIPHLMCPVVTEMSKAAAILEWCVTQMEERYSLLAEAGVRNLDAYNKMSWEDLKDRFSPSTPEEEAQIPKKLARIVFVIDELADLMMTHKEVESFIVRIAQKARAVGIHLILATQRPQANVVTGLIKSNMPCRVAMKVASGMDSRIVLDSKGAELLLGHGDMLYLSPHTHKLMRAQGSLVDDSEVRQVVKFLKSVASQCFEPQLVQLKAPGLGETDEEKDPLFNDAVDVLVETRRGSVSLLQRRLAIGYSRASRLVEQMAQSGILGEFKGSQAREVAITKEEWEMMKSQMASDAAYTDAAPAGGVREISGGNAVRAPEAAVSDADADPVARGGTDIDDPISGSTDVDVEPVDVDDDLVAQSDADDAEEVEYVDDETEEEAELRRMATGADDAAAKGGDDEYEEYEYVEDEDPA